MDRDQFRGCVATSGLTGREIGARLDALEWCQGAALDMVGYAFVHDPSTPVSAPGRAAAKSVTRSTKGAQLPAIAVAQAGRPGDLLIVTTQTCDILKPPDQQPFVNAIRGFFTTNQEILDAADRHSWRYFLIDPDRRLVADAAYATEIEKGVLLGRTPLYSPPADGVRRRHFARWLAHRLVREPLDDGVEYGVADPIRRALSAQRVIRPETVQALREVRVFHLEGTPPYGVQLVFMVDERDRERLPGSIAEVVAALREEFEPGVAEVLDWDVLSEDTISVADYSASDQVFFEADQGPWLLSG